MTNLLRALYVVNITLCAALAVGGLDVGDNIIQAALWSLVWSYSEEAWIARKARA